MVYSSKFQKQELIFSSNTKAKRYLCKFLVKLTEKLLHLHHLFIKSFISSLEVIFVLWCIVNHLVTKLNTITIFLQQTGLSGEKYSFTYHIFATMISCFFLMKQVQLQYILSIQKWKLQTKIFLLAPML